MANKRGRPKTQDGDDRPERWTINLPLKFKGLFEQLRAKARRTLVEEVSIALEQYLEAAGLWPPPEDAEESEENS